MKATTNTLKMTTKLLLAAAMVLAPQLASAQQTVQVGVFLPQANFADNSARGVYADAVAGAMTKASGGAITFRGTAFAKLSDLGAFLKANKIDILLADGVWLASRGGKIIAHAVDGSGKASRPAALYGSLLRIR